MGCRHQSNKLGPEFLLADCGFDSHGKAGQIREHLDKIEKSVDAVKCGMTRRADAILPDRNTADSGDLRRYLGGRQNAAEPGLRTLAELDLDGANRRRGQRFQKPIL
jgi:hypothetical protein